MSRKISYNERIPDMQIQTQIIEIESSFENLDRPSRIFV